jgi:hypothetical protein
MQHGMFARGALTMACLFALPPIAAADDFAAPSCETGREKSRYGGHSWCRVTLPNGDFAGAPPPVGTETGDYKHPWESSFSWWRITPRRDHPIGDHLKPWGFYGEGTPSYPTGIHAKPGVVLNNPGDSIFQWIDVPTYDGMQTTATQYTVRVTYAPYNTGGDVGIGMKIIVADENGERISKEFEGSAAGMEGRPATFEAQLTVPRYTPISQLGVAIGKAADASPLLIQDVAIVEKTFPDIDIDF